MSIIIDYEEHRLNFWEKNVLKKGVLFYLLFIILLQFLLIILYL